MASTLDRTLGVTSETLEFEIEARRQRLPRQGFIEAGMVTAWEAQSQLAAITLIALVALAPIWVATLVMLAWSLAATCVYAWSRKRGLPDLLEGSWSRPPWVARQMGGWLAGTSLSVVKAWLAGVQPYLYCLLFGRFFGSTGAGWRFRAARLALFGAGLTFFGVTAAHHILRKSNFRDKHVWRMSLAGPFLNVPYRIALSAVLLNAVLHVAKPLTS